MLRYTAGELQALPEDEALFFLMCGQLHNDLSILMRQVLQARIEDDQSEPEKLSAATTGHLNMRFLAGRLAEGWKLVEHRFQKIFAEAEGVTPSDMDKLKWLSRHFSSKGLVRDMRGNVVFHYDQNIARKALRSMDPSEPMIDMHTRSIGNTIFFSGESLLLASAHELTGVSDLLESLNSFGSEILEVTRRMTDVIHAYMLAFSRRHFAEKLSHLAEEKVILRDQPRLERFRAPLYLATGPQKPNGRQTLLSSTSTQAFK